jgi:hypothetical protein
MQNGFSPWIRALGRLLDEKNWGLKISRHCFFKFNKNNFPCDFWDPDAKSRFLDRKMKLKCAIQ